jgi:soluble lytic murein transglycosylase-like protein
MLMHDRESNDGFVSLVPIAPQKIRQFPLASDADPSSRVFAAVMFLMMITAAALFALAHSTTRNRYSGEIRTRSAVFVKAFSAVDKAWLQQKQRWAAAYAQEREMSFSQLINRWQPMIADASKRFGIPAAWIKAVMKTESGGRTMLAADKPITSSTGAVGLMQLMPGTYQQMRAQHQLGANPANPRDNIMAGAAYLRWLHRKYGFPAMFMAYNDGPGNLEAHRDHGRALPQETKNYITRICAALGSPAPAAAGGALVKFVRPNGKPVWIDSSAVAAVRRPLPGEYAKSVRAVITVGRTRQGIRESVTAARAALHLRSRMA